MKGCFCGLLGDTGAHESEDDEHGAASRALPPHLKVRWEDLQFRDKDVVGRGGHGTVFKGGWQGNRVAIKVVSPHRVSDEAREALYAEALTMSQLQHPYIARVFGVVDDREHLAIVMQYYRRGNLEAFMCGPRTREAYAGLDMARRVQMACMVASAMHYLASKHPPVVHGDLKASNVLLDDTMNVFITDFGLASRRTHPIRAPRPSTADDAPPRPRPRRARRPSPPPYVPPPQLLPSAQALQHAQQLQQERERQRLRQRTTTERTRSDGGWAPPDAGGTAPLPVVTLALGSPGRAVPPEQVGGGPLSLAVAHGVRGLSHNGTFSPPRVKHSIGVGVAEAVEGAWEDDAVAVTVAAPARPPREGRQRKELQVEVPAPPALQAVAPEQVLSPGTPLQVSPSPCAPPSSSSSSWSSEGLSVRAAAPEVLRDPAAPRDVPGDVYSFGVLLLQICMGRDPYEGVPAAAVRQWVLEGRPPPVPACVPAGVAAVVEQCTAWDPRARPGFAVVIRQLEAAKRELAPNLDDNTLLGF